jgi:hypothetical protein
MNYVIVTYQYYSSSDAVLRGCLANRLSMDSMVLSSLLDGVVRDPKHGTTLSSGENDVERVLIAMNRCVTAQAGNIQNDSNTRLL